MPEEIEIKLNLENETNYLKLHERFGRGIEPRRQDNHFFDSPDMRLAASGWALRIRLEAGRALMTAKSSASGGGGALAVRHEIETALDPDRARAMIDNGLMFGDIPDTIRDALGNLPADLALTAGTGFVNYRTDIGIETGHALLRVEIDRTCFNDGRIDYELELELEDRADYPDALGRLTAVFENMGLPLIFQDRSKLARAREC